MGRRLIAVANAYVQGEIGTDSPVVLEVAAVVGIYRKVGCALLGVRVAVHISQHDIRQRDATGVREAVTVALQSVGAAEGKGQSRVGDIVVNVVLPQPFIPKLEGMSSNYFGEVLVELMRVVYIDPHRTDAELRAAIRTFRHPEVDGIEVDVGGQIRDSLGYGIRLVFAT